MKPSILWFRNDLRLGDNPALRAAHDRGGAVIPVFVHDPDGEAPWAPGAASRWWLHQSLEALASELDRAGSRLIVRRGQSGAVLRELAAECGAEAVFWNRRYEPSVLESDASVKRSLEGDGLSAETFNASLLHEPGEVLNGSGKPYKVFTPFWRSCLELGDPPPPLAAPRKLEAPGSWPASLEIEELGLEPAVDWAATMRRSWSPGSKGARAELNRFLKEAVNDYGEDRNRPDRVGTSRLSPHLHFGEISPREIWKAYRVRAEKSGRESWRTDQFLAEVGWREFSHQLLYHFPHTSSKPLRPEFEKFPWRDDEDMLNAWQRGRTGYPIVDAGMRELWATGWMHNRVRMVVASFLVKDLLIPWTKGARWFWDTLVDADLAQNTLGWQWTAGCGADAAPFFRVFNPMAQGEKFDPEGDYVRRWCPELGELPNRWIHRPWEAPEAILSEAGLRLGDNYPVPLVDHARARNAALRAYDRIKKKQAGSPGK